METPVGPREWSPWIRRLADSLLNEEERRKLIELRGKYLNKSPLPEAETQEILWLCETVKRLAKLKPDEFDFPEKAALINHVNDTAFVMRLGNLVHIERDIVITPEHTREGGIIFEYRNTNEVCEALLVVRPWIKVSPTVTDALFEKLKGIRLTFSVSGSWLESDSPAEKFLFDPAGIPLRRKPPCFIPRKGGVNFSAVSLEGVEVKDHWLQGEQIMALVQNATIGTFLANEDTFVMRVEPPEEPLDAIVDLKFGLIAARYTVRA